MKAKTVLVLFAVITIFALPAVAAAEGVLWSSETYRAYAYAKAYEEGYIYDVSSQESFSPPSTLPISASAYAFTWNGETGIYSNNVYGDADASVSSSGFNVAVSALSW